MYYTPCIRNRVEEYLRAHDWKYEMDEDRGGLIMNVSLNNTKLQECGILILLRKDYYIVYATTDIRAGEDCRDKVADYLSRVNYGLRFGNFELDMIDGEIRFKTFVDCGKDCDCMPTDAVIERSLRSPRSALETYGDSLLAVMFGFMTPEEAVQKAEERK